MKQRTFAIGDIHGHHKALLQCLDRSGFDYDQDKLIVLGDVCDGWPFVRECFDELLKIKHLVYVLGNHDEWTLEWFDRDGMYKNNPYIKPDTLWTSQGGAATLKSYESGNDYDANQQWVMPTEHLDILRNAKLYYIDGNDIFVHAGIMEGYPVEQCGRETLLWSRDMIERAANVHQYNPDFKINKYNTIWCGHTTTQAFVTHKMKSRLTKEEIAIEGTKPMFVCNVINLDTGAGWSGRLTIMDTATKQYWQSDFVQTLYPDIKGRWG